MLNQFAVEIPTLPVDQCHSHLIRYLKGCWGILSYRRAAEKGRQAFGTHGISGNVFFFFFANPHASSSAPYPQELNPWGTTIEEPLHTSTVEKSERPEQNRDLRLYALPSDSQAATESLLSWTSAAWRLRSFQSESQLFLDFRQTISQEKHQIKPLLLRHILVVLRFTLRLAMWSTSALLLGEQCVQLLAILIKFGSTLSSFTRHTRLVESLLDCTLQHSVLAWSLG